jgi:hypothetical protein
VRCVIINGFVALVAAWDSLAGSGGRKGRSVVAMTNERDSIGYWNRSTLPTNLRVSCLSRIENANGQMGALLKTGTNGCGARN